MTRSPILRLKRNGLLLDRIEVLSDGGNFVVQEIPIRGINIAFEAHNPGIVTIELHADLVTVED